MSEQQIAQIEMTMEQAKEDINLAKALDKLKSNREFKKIITEGYFKDEAIRLVNMKGHPQARREDIQADIIKQIDAIGCLNAFFDMIYHRAEWAKSAIEASEEELNYLHETAAEEV